MMNLSVYLGLNALIVKILVQEIVDSFEYTITDKHLVHDDITKPMQLEFVMIKVG